MNQGFSLLSSKGGGPWLTREFLDVKVIAMSGAAEQEENLKAARLLGARQTLQKPFSVDQLLGAVSYELKH
jgi:hypothetical protein